ncbi:MAG: hypothetical protein RSA21_07325 [Akkermansia sp.]
MALLDSIETDAREVADLPPLHQLLLWRDPIARIGREAMAADEALLEWGGMSVIRAYAWARPTVTYGYFDSEQEAQAIFPDSGIDCVRRWTGGGIVDHRADIPFSLALRWIDCVGHPTGVKLYRWIHRAVARVLIDDGVDCLMLADDAPNGGRACFSSPVTSDLVSSQGYKLAGGGQRRSHQGVLHQGSIQNCQLSTGWDLKLAKLLATEVSVSHEVEPYQGFTQKVDELIATKYGTSIWNQGGRRRSPQSTKD